MTLTDVSPISRRIATATLLGVSLCAAGPVAQQAQNPSPMVEHTRAHARLPTEAPAGRRETLQLGTLFVPAGVKQKARLVIHFHGGALVPDIAAARLGGTAVISMQLGTGSGPYGRAFADPKLFGRIVAEAEAKSHLTLSPIILTSWSAGYGAVRAILRVPENYARVDRVVLLDGMHASYVGDAPSTGPGQESVLVRPDLEIFVQFARDAIAGTKRMIVTHSEIFPGTYASTTETTDWLVSTLGLKLKAVLKWGPGGMQQLSEARAGKFQLLGYAGNSAPDHVDQLQALPDLLKLIK
jgi:hypothetical protein